MKALPTKHISPMNTQPLSDLKIDLDEEWEIINFIDRYRFVFERVHIPVKDISIVRSRGGGWHIRIMMDCRLDPPVIIALQAMLGSDWKRETFNLMRILWTEMKHWNTLFHGTERPQKQPSNS